MCQQQRDDGNHSNEQESNAAIATGKTVQRLYLAAFGYERTEGKST
jgi:hypothetical protein